MISSINTEWKSRIFLIFSPHKADSMDQRGACQMVPPVNEWKKINQLFTVLRAWGSQIQNTEWQPAPPLVPVVTRAKGVLNTQGLINASLALRKARSLKQDNLTYQGVLWRGRNLDSLKNDLHPLNHSPQLFQEKTHWGGETSLGFLMYRPSTAYPCHLACSSC